MFTTVSYVSVCLYSVTVLTSPKRAKQLSTVANVSRTHCHSPFMALYAAFKLRHVVRMRIRDMTYFVTFIIFCVSHIRILLCRHINIWMCSLFISYTVLTSPKRAKQLSTVANVSRTHCHSPFMALYAAFKLRHVVRMRIRDMTYFVTFIIFCVSHIRILLCRHINIWMCSLFISYTVLTSPKRAKQLSTVANVSRTHCHSPFMALYAAFKLRHVVRMRIRDMTYFVTFIIFCVSHIRILLCRHINIWMCSLFISYTVLTSPKRAKQLSTVANVSRTHCHSPFMALYAAFKLRHVVRMRIRDMTYFVTFIIFCVSHIRILLCRHINIWMCSLFISYTVLTSPKRAKQLSTVANVSRTHCHSPFMALYAAFKLRHVVRMRIRDMTYFVTFIIFCVSHIRILLCRHINIWMCSLFISYTVLTSPKRAKQLSTVANVSRTHCHSPFMALYAAFKLRHVVRMRIRDMTYFVTFIIFCVSHIRILLCRHINIWMCSLFISYTVLTSPKRAKQLSTVANVSRTHCHSPFMALYAAFKLRHVVRMRIRDMTYFVTFIIFCVSHIRILLCRHIYIYIYIYIPGGAKKSIRV